MRNISKQMPEVDITTATGILLTEEFNTLMVDHTHLDYMRDILLLFYQKGGAAALKCVKAEILGDE